MARQRRRIPPEPVSPLALSLSKGWCPWRRGFDKLSPNGGDAAAFALLLKTGARHTLLASLSAESTDHEDTAALLWAGDLDHDGKIDLLFSYSGYNKAGACLYLSAGADPGELVKLAACHGGLGC